MRILFATIAALLAVVLYFFIVPSIVTGRASELRSARSDAPVAIVEQARWRDSPFALGAHDVADPKIAMANNTLLRAPHGEPILGRNGRAVDFGGRTPQQYIAQWSALARTGNVDAAYRVYQAESVCATTDDPETDFINAAERAQFVAQRDALKKTCVGVTPAQVQERLQFLNIAARGGNAAAQIDFYTEGPNGKNLDLAESKDDPVVAQWKKDAVGFLKNAGDQGEPFALGLLSMAYDVGELVPQDEKLSLAYAVAESTLRKRPALPEQLRRRYANQLSEAEFQQALQLGKQMAQDCCKN